MNKIILGTGLLAVIMVTGALYTGISSNNLGNEVVGGKAQVSIASVSDVRGLAAIFSSNKKVITWETLGLTSGETVDINLIKRTSNSPVTYVLVRKIADNLKNSGSFTWEPAQGEISSDLFIEVTCSGETNDNGCEIISSPVSVK